MLRPRLDSQGQELQTVGNSHTLRSARGLCHDPHPSNQQPAFRCILIAAVLWASQDREAGRRHPRPSRETSLKPQWWLEWCRWRQLCVR